jgi:hypothetical protein
MLGVYQLSGNPYAVKTSLSKVAVTPAVSQQKSKSDVGTEYAMGKRTVI